MSSGHANSIGSTRLSIHLIRLKNNLALDAMTSSGPGNACHVRTIVTATVACQPRPEIRRTVAELKADGRITDRWRDPPDL
jgi:hypothetical protein